LCIQNDRKSMLYHAARSTFGQYTLRCGSMDGWLQSTFTFQILSKWGMAICTIGYLAA
jgi:hypothetical protein